jgi:hypothetical protein
MGRSAYLAINDLNAAIFGKPLELAMFGSPVRARKGCCTSQSRQE